MDKYRKLGVTQYIFGVCLDFGPTDFYRRIKDSPSAQEPLGIKKFAKLSKGQLDIDLKSI